MTNKNFGWHKAWSWDAQGHLAHNSGLRFLATYGDTFVDLEIDDASLAIFQAKETARGVPVHQLMERLQRLTKEAQMHQKRNR